MSVGLAGEPPAVLVAEIFVGAALVGNLAAWLLNSFLPLGTWAVGFIEEGVKFLSVVWLLRRRRYVSIMDGILFGAAAGTGFAASENLSCFFRAHPGTGVAAVFAQDGRLTLGRAQQVFNQSGLASFFGTLTLRSILGPWMHGSWTAIIAGTA